MLNKHIDFFVQIIYSENMQYVFHIKDLKNSLKLMSDLEKKKDLY